MSYIKALPLAFVLAMLATLTSMTVYPVYTLIVELPVNSLPNHAEKFTESSGLSDTWLKPHIDRIKLNKLRPMQESLYSTQKLKSIQAEEVDVQKSLLLNTINERTIIVKDTKDIILTFHVKNNYNWKNVFRLGLNRYLEFSDTFPKNELKNHIYWETNYTDIIKIFLWSFATALFFTLVICFFRNRAEK